MRYIYWIWYIMKRSCGAICFNYKNRSNLITYVLKQQTNPNRKRNNDTNKNILCFIQIILECSLFYVIPVCCLIIFLYEILYWKCIFSSKNQITATPFSCSSISCSCTTSSCDDEWYRERKCCKHATAFDIHPAQLIAWENVKYK